MLNIFMKNFGQSLGTVFIKDIMELVDIDNFREA